MNIASESEPESELEYIRYKLYRHYIIINFLSKISSPQLCSLLGIKVPCFLNFTLYLLYGQDCKKTCLNVILELDQTK